ncbi:hypothetical protein ACFLUG_03735 [Chloroflexota bacterium]
MSIPNSKLSVWGQRYPGNAPKQVLASIRDALAGYTGWAEKPGYEIFLQGSHDNDTDLGRDTNVDIVVQLGVRLPSRVGKLDGIQLEQDEEHIQIHEQWESVRRHLSEALITVYSTDTVISGEKSIRIMKGIAPTSTEIIAAVGYGDGMAFFIEEDQRWVVQYPRQHQKRGLKKEKTTSNRFKRTIRMFKSARNHLVANRVISEKTASSYFIECLLFNVPDNLFKGDYRQTYSGIITFLKKANLKQFNSQNGMRPLFGQEKDQWNAGDALTFILALERMWVRWPRLS